MSWIAVAWSMAAAVCLTLMAIHLVIGLRQRSPAHLLFSATALSAAASAVCEFLLMKSGSVERFTVMLRLAHVPIWALYVSLILFMRAYLRAGRPWLAWAAIATRTLALVLNFLLWPNLNYRSIRAVVPVPLWGGETIFVAEGVTSPWVRVGQLSSLLMLLFLVDATRTAWRRGDRRHALVVGGSAIVCVVLAAVHFALVNEGIVRSPFLISFAYLLVVAAMAYELTLDVLRASELSVRLQATDAALEESRKDMALAVDAANVGLWVWDVDRNVLSTTASALSFGVGSAPERIDLERFLSSIHPDDRERIRLSVAESLASRGEFDREYRIVRPDGETRWIAARGRVESDGDGRPVRMRGVIIDVTARRNAELEVDRQRDELAHLSRVTMLGELSGSLAHELNQPLAAILSNAEAAQNYLSRPGADLDEVRAILGDIVEDDKLAGEIIRRLRLLLRKGEVEPQPLEANEVVRDVLKLMRSDLLNRGVAVSLELDPDLPPVLGDRVQIQQVLLNLVANACDAMEATPPGQRRLRVCTASQDGDGVRLSVADCGSGVPEAESERVFEPFFTTKADGMGLGLAICRTIVTAHRGRLWDENNADGGATFHFTLPPAPARTA
jgi:PAS domain S-box-containing protein